MNFNRSRKFRRKKRFYFSTDIKSALVCLLLAALFVSIIWFSAVYYLPQNPHLFSGYLAETIPLYKTFLPREEDILKDNLSVATFHYLLGINVTNPTTLIKAQIPVFNQFEYTPVIPVTPPIDKEPDDNGEIVNPPLPREPSEGGLVGKTILIYHSHTTEAFVPTSGIPHTEKFDETIVKVGEKLTEALRNLGATVIHDTTHHSKRHSESYRRSRETVLRYLNSGVEFDLIIDLHRDGIGQSSELGRPITTTTINGVQMGRLLFVVGQRHDSWRNNYILAQSLNNMAKSLYPVEQESLSISRGVVLKTSGNYNQDLSDKMILIEIGGHWNTLEEAINTVEPLAQIINKTIGD
ncbi:stage II sporulation protein P [Anaerobranca gottschalkii]|uniref:Stage II sporulation protein P (SpoIIP) n=1 Tax=Anaerobranca gottschalkii DSM 13577 TaxID=1120990 RepID=A0A1H9YCF1_9FIRM|nr:stage II sporulation protein P [Anaerobranca gottschalkii]SES66506.1 Stage II sporulation protein P (SpoIIP) [Anaerobranca gottschalkii DSM 13577]